MLKTYSRIIVPLVENTIGAIERIVEEKKTFRKSSACVIAI